MKDLLNSYIKQVEKTVTTRTHRLGVTGFSRSGKTVFVTQLTHSLLRLNQPLTEECPRHPLTGLDDLDTGKLKPARLNDTSLSKRSQFQFYKHRDSIMGRGEWPEPTSDLTWLEIELNRSSTEDSWLSKFSPPTLQLEIMDYPGEWLSDLPLIQMNYSQWSKKALELAEKEHRKEISCNYRALLNEICQRYAGQSQVPEDQVRLLQDAWKAYLEEAYKKGFVLNQPGRALMPGDMKGMPIINFIPIPSDCDLPELIKAQSKVFDEYKNQIERRLGTHFQKLDSQIVMVDLLKALEQGKDAMDELKEALHEALRFFRYSSSSSLFPWLSRKIKRVVFAATKADQLIQQDRINLEKLLGALLDEIDPGNDVRARSEVNYIALASIEAATTTIGDDGNEYVIGKERDGDAEMFFSGSVPDKLPIDWVQLSVKLNAWAPLKRVDDPNKLLPAYQLGRAVNHLLKDEL